MSDVKWKLSKRSKVLAQKYGTTVRVSRYDYKLIFCSELFYEGREVWGLHDHESRVLYVVDTPSLVITMLHEMFHAEIEAAGMRQMPDWNVNLEELVVELCARFISTTYELRRRRRS